MNKKPNLAEQTKIKQTIEWLEGQIEDIEYSTYEGKQQIKYYERRIKELKTLLTEGKLWATTKPTPAPT